MDCRYRLPMKAASIRTLVIWIIILSGLKIVMGYCEPGTYDKDENVCVPCSPGSYQPKRNASHCEFCPRGTAQGRSGSIDCDECVAGEAAREEGSVSCSLCPLGTYTNRNRTVSCTSCPPGWYADEPGSTSCKLCPPGSYQNEPGWEECKLCEKGKYQPAAGSTMCLPCEHDVGPGSPECNPKGCESILAPSHGSVNSSSREVGATATFSCLPGYSLNGTTVTTCLQDGQWDSQPPICTVNLCPDLKADPIWNGWGYYSSSPPPRHPGNTYNQNCQGGYFPIGIRTRLCLNNGTWDGQKLICLKECDRLEGLPNGTIVYSTGTNQPVEGSTATFQCRMGFRLQGQETATCTAQGTWSTETPSCTKDHNSKKTITSLEFYVAGGGVFALILCFTLFGCSRIWCGKRRKIRRVQVESEPRKVPQLRTCRTQLTVQINSCASDNLPWTVPDDSNF